MTIASYRFGTINVVTKVRHMTLNNRIRIILTYFSTHICYTAHFWHHSVPM